MFDQINIGYMRRRMALGGLVLLALACQNLFSAPLDTSEAEGDRLLADGHYRAAVRALQRAVDQQPESADRYRKLAAAYAKDEQLPEAVAAYQKAIELRTDYA